MKRILIVEDNPLNMELVRDLLNAHGYHVAEATDATECREQLKLEIPDLILMDIQLPGLDGFTLVQQLRAEEQFSQLPIIALTAYAMRGDREKALAAGCSGFISKPIHTQKFIQTIQEYLGE